MGSSALISSMFLLSSDEDSDHLAESAFQSYVDKYLGGGAEIRLAPPVVNQAHGYRIALLLVYKGNETADLFFRNGAVTSKVDPAPPAQKGFHQHHHHHASAEGGGGGESSHRDDEPQGGDEDDVSHMTGDEDVFSRDGGSDDDDDDDDEDDQFHLDEEAVAQLEKKWKDLEAERERALFLNSDLQKKCSSILARIGRDTQSRNGPPGGGDQQGQDHDAPVNNTMDNNTAEKENHFFETLSSISDGRSKLLKQQTEYEQLAYDLQTRLDEKEYKAEEIGESLNEFKREILTKAENSRTAQGLSKRLIKQYEFNEKKKDNELEKVVNPTHLTVSISPLPLLFSSPLVSLSVSLSVSLPLSVSLSVSVSLSLSLSLSLSSSTPLLLSNYRFVFVIFHLKQH
jgi:hypothetical protein